MKTKLKHELERVALWWLRRSGYWTRINTIEGVDAFVPGQTEWQPVSWGHQRQIMFGVYEAGRHRLLMQLIENRLRPRTDKRPPTSDL